MDSKVMVIALNTFREAIRNKILYTVILFAVLVIIVSALFGNVSIGDQEKVIKDFGLFSLSFFGAVLAIVCGVSLLAKELNQKTIYNILSKPVSRWQFILGKHLGLAITVNLLVSIMGLALIGFVACFERRIDWLLFQGIAFVLLEVTVISAVTIFFSSVVITTTLTGIFTLSAYIAGRSIGYLRVYLTDSITQSELVRTLTQVLDWIIPDLSVFNLSNQLVYGTPATLPQFGLALVYATSYCTVTLVLAVLVFNRRELQ